jgi:hypothetical protein
VAFALTGAVKRTTVAYVKDTVEEEDNPMTDAVTVDVNVESTLDVGVPTRTADAPGKVPETVERVSPGGRFVPLNTTVLDVAVSGYAVMVNTGLGANGIPIVRSAEFELAARTIRWPSTWIGRSVDTIAPVV